MSKVRVKDLENHLAKDGTLTDSAIATVKTFIPENSRFSEGDWHLVHTVFPESPVVQVVVNRGSVPRVYVSDKSAVVRLVDLDYKEDPDRDLLAISRDCEDVGLTLYDFERQQNGVVGGKGDGVG